MQTENTLRYVFTYRSDKDPKFGNASSLTGWERPLHTHSLGECNVLIPREGDVAMLIKIPQACTQWSLVFIVQTCLTGLEDMHRLFIVASVLLKMFEHNINVC